MGRLDADSEGLLLLTNNNRLKTQLLDPERGHELRKYVQVEGVPTEDQSTTVCPPCLEDQGKVSNARAKVKVISPAWPERVPPIRVRKTVPDTWLELTLTEGKNRQVRRMTAAVGLPTLRLIRVSMGPWKLDKLPPGQWQELNMNLWNA